MGKRKNKHPNQSIKNISPLSQKEKKKKQLKKSSNKIDSGLPQNFESFQSNISQLKEQALSEYKETVKMAEKTYDNLINSIDQSEIILQVLDARDPHGSRILEIEKIIKEKGKLLINVINKIDLIPKEVAIRWLGDPSFQIDELSQLMNYNSTHDQSILNNYNNNVSVTAISSKTDAEQKQAWDLLHDIITKSYTNLQQCPTISIIGIKNVGKSTICSFLNANKDGIFDKVLEVPSYSFISSTDSAAILNAIEYCGYITDFWLDFASRSQDDSIFDALGIEPTEEIDDLMSEYSKVIHKKEIEATNEIMEKLLNGSQTFFSIPEDTEASNVNEFQQKILDSLLSAENGDDSIHINRGDPLVIDSKLLKQKDA